MLGGQQYGLMPGGGARKPGVLSATCPGGQQISSEVLKREVGQQTCFELPVIPISPAAIWGAHFVLDGQQIRLPSTVQHGRPSLQHRSFPQQRDVFRSQHFFPHSSWSLRQRLQRRIFSLAQFHFGGQHLFCPHHA